MLTHGTTVLEQKTNYASVIVSVITNRKLHHCSWMLCLIAVEKGKNSWVAHGFLSLTNHDVKQKIKSETLFTKVINRRKV